MTGKHVSGVEAARRDCPELDRLPHVLGWPVHHVVLHVGGKTHVAQRHVREPPLAIRYELDALPVDEVDLVVDRFGVKPRNLSDPGQRDLCNEKLEDGLVLMRSPLSGVPLRDREGRSALPASEPGSPLAFTPWR